MKQRANIRPTHEQRCHHEPLATIHTPLIDNQETKPKKERQ